MGTRVRLSLTLNINHRTNNRESAGGDDRKFNIMMISKANLRKALGDETFTLTRKNSVDFATEPHVVSSMREMNLANIASIEYRCLSEIQLEINLHAGFRRTTFTEI